MIFSNSSSLNGFNRKSTAPFIAHTLMEYPVASDEDDRQTADLQQRAPAAILRPLSSGVRTFRRSKRMQPRASEVLLPSRRSRFGSRRNAASGQEPAVRLGHHPLQTQLEPRCSL